MVTVERRVIMMVTTRASATVTDSDSGAIRDNLKAEGQTRGVRDGHGSGGKCDSHGEGHPTVTETAAAIMTPDVASNGRGPTVTEVACVTVT